MIYLILTYLMMGKEGNRSLARQVLQQIGVDCIDESEVLTVADEGNHVNKNKFKACAANPLQTKGSYFDVGS